MYSLAVQSSSDLGRKSLPKGVKKDEVVAFKVDKAMADDLDAEIERQLAENGEEYTRGTFMRKLLRDALVIAQADAKHSKKK